MTDVLSTSVTLRRCKLVRVSVDGSVAEYIFDQPDVTLGGHEDNDLVIDDPRVSRRHAQLRAEGERYYLFDLNATGGTFVNGLRIHQKQLRAGDVISLAGFPLVFGVENAPAPGETQEYTPHSPAS